MKARKFPASDYKSKDSRWEVYYQNFNMDSYLQTLDFDDVTIFLNQCTSTMNRNIKILDVGCGSGRHIAHLHRQGFRNLLGIDIAKHGILNIKKNFPDVKVQVGSATDLPYENNSFDLVVMVGIVYEIPESSLHSRVFSEISRVLKPGGKLIFINNSPYNLGERIFTFTQKIGWVFKREPMKFFVWRYEEKDVENHLKSSGLKKMEVWPANINRGVFRFFYGIFVPKDVKNGRRKRMRSTDGHPYNLHEYYLVHKDLSLLTKLGRIAVRLSKNHFPRLFANTFCYLIEKPAE